MKTNYNKLVRDRIPEIIVKDDCCLSFDRLPNHLRVDALIEKIHEEFLELKDSKSNEEKIEELADVLEIVFTIGKECGFPMYKLLDFMEEKRKIKGGFEKGYILYWVKTESEEE